MRRFLAYVLLAGMSGGLIGCEDKKSTGSAVESGTTGMKGGSGAPPPPPPPPMPSR